MAITEKTDTTLGLLPNGDIQVKEVKIITRDGEDFPGIPHYRVIDVEDDVSGESAELQSIAAIVQTEERREVKREARRAEQMAQREAELAGGE